jgi:hypothetical protein
MAAQNFSQALCIADRGYVIVHGQIAFEGRSSQELNNNELIKKFYWDSERIYRLDRRFPPTDHAWCNRRSALSCRKSEPANRNLTAARALSDQTNPA